MTDRLRQLTYCQRLLTWVVVGGLLEAALIGMYGTPRW